MKKSILITKVKDGGSEIGMVLEEPLLQNLASTIVRAASEAAKGINSFSNLARVAEKASIYESEMDEAWHKFDTLAYKQFSRPNVRYSSPAVGQKVGVLDVPQSPEDCLQKLSALKSAGFVVAISKGLIL